MRLPSSQKSSVIEPSQPKMAAVGDPHGGEILMELYAKPFDVFLVAGQLNNGAEENDSLSAHKRSESITRL